ncbi:serine/threonine-protein kinase [Streptomyces orinoci]|uniref:Serine/threonine-protein kinase n=1 Tax=Streptomyces orinoci TaxID=67339 RepID=A0ABV3JXC1_STRON|nr:serine/threonine-protein kinase [Streptomyces orinoci]
MPPLRSSGTGPEAEDPEYAGRYRLEGRLGSGGMGVVHLARSPSGLRLAVKVVHAEYAADPEFRARFRQEVLAARRVSGAFTAPVVDADPDCERPWMATLCISGPTLAERIKRNGPLTPDEVRRLAAGLAEALRDIHRAGVVHRDLKPSNVLLAADGPKVIDFGISRPYDSDLRTETGKLIGTPPFMAPEQFQRPREVGPAADVFALASVLVHAATGRGPFESESPYIVAYQVVHDEPQLTGVPEDLIPLIKDCLAKDPAARPTPDTIMSRLPRWADGGSWALLAGPSAEEQAADGTAGPSPEPDPGGEEASVPSPAEEATGEAVAEPALRRARNRRRALWFASAAVAAVALGAGAKWATGEFGGTDNSGHSRAASRGAVWHPWQAPLPEVRGDGPRPGFCSYAEAALYCSAPGLHAARVDTTEGRVRWRRAAEGRPSDRDAVTAPVFSGGLVLVPSPDGRELTALDPATGTPRWKRNISAYGGRTYTVGDTVLLADRGGMVTAVNSATGLERWRHPLPGVRNPVLVSYGVGPAYVVAPTAEHGTQVLAVDPDSGQTLWQWTGRGTLSPAGTDQDGDTLFLTEANADDQVSAVLRYDPASGHEQRVPLTRPVSATSAVSHGDAVYVLSSDGGLTAVDIAEGRQLWRLETSVANASPLVAEGHRLYFSSADGRLLAVDTRRGTLLGQTAPRPAQAGQGFTGTLPTPVVADGKVFGSGPDGTVFAVDARDPREWK